MIPVGLPLQTRAATLPDSPTTRRSKPDVTPDDRVRLRFDPSRGLLMAENTATGETVTAHAFSASKKGPIPPGVYSVKRLTDAKWRLDAKDKSPNDDVVAFGNGSAEFNALRLHGGTISRGCITVNAGEWPQVNEMLRSAGGSTVEDDSSVRQILGDTYSLPKWIATPAGQNEVVGDLVVGPISDGPLARPRADDNPSFIMKSLDWSSPPAGLIDNIY